MTWALFRKDLRLLMPVFVGAFLLALMFYVGLPATAAYDFYHTDGGSLQVANRRLSADVTAAFLQGTMFVMLTFPLWAAVVGGMAFAYERRERWGDLIGTLPVSRRRTVGVKLAACVVAGVLLYLGNALAAAAVGAARGWWMDLNRYGDGNWFRGAWSVPSVLEFLEVGATTFGIGAAMFGVAWWLSSILRSPVIAACVSIGLTLVAMCLVLFAAKGQVMYGTRLSNEVKQAISQYALPWGAAIVSVVIGAICQRVRSDP